MNKMCKYRKCVFSLRIILIQNLIEKFHRLFVEGMTAMLTSGLACAARLLCVSNETVVVRHLQIQTINTVYHLDLLNMSQARLGQ